MIDDRTPLQRLDDAIHDFSLAVGDEGTLAGWVLVYQAQMLADEGPDIDPVQWDAGYSLAPGMSPFAAIGLVDHIRTVIRDAYATAHEEDDDL